MHATMEKRLAKRTKQTEFPAVLSFDPGPSMRQRRDGTLISRGPGEVTLEDREDLEGRPNARGDLPIIRAARRRDALLELFRGETIDKRQFVAASRYLDDCSIANAGGGTANLSGAGGGSSDGMAQVMQRRIDANGRCRDALKAMGPSGGVVFHWVVFTNKSLASWDASKKQRHGAAASMLKAALICLDDFYNRK